MAMSITSEDDEIISTINTTPLVDVMLVLLIIFLITVPVVTASIPVHLPQADNHLDVSKPQTAVVTVTAAGAIHLNGSKPMHDAELMQALNVWLQNNPALKIEIRGDQQAEFGAIDKVLKGVTALGVPDVGFAIEPIAH